MLYGLKQTKVSKADVQNLFRNKLSSIVGGKQHKSL